MHRTLLSLALLVLLGTGAACREAAPEAPTSDDAPTRTYRQGDSLRVSGVLIDTRCFALDKANLTDDHTRPEGQVPGCAGACARQGFPVAILEGGKPDGYVWVLSFPPQVFADYMGRTVRVDGVFRSQGILIPHRVEMRSGDGWTVIM